MNAARVVCIKADGRRVEFQIYDDARDADRIAARLREIGCNATVEPCEAREQGADANGTASTEVLGRT
jgi:hypothetical protein